MKNELTSFLKDKFSDSLISFDEFRETVSYRVKPESLVSICKALHESNEFAFKYLAEISCVDWLGHEQEKDGRF